MAHWTCVDSWPQKEGRLWIYTKLNIPLKNYLWCLRWLSFMLNQLNINKLLCLSITYEQWSLKLMKLKKKDWSQKKVDKGIPIAIGHRLAYHPLFKKQDSGKKGHDQVSSGQAQNDVTFFLFLAKSAKMIIDGSETNYRLSRVWMLLKGTGLSQSCLKVYCKFPFNRWVNFTPLESKVRNTLFL